MEERLKRCRLCLKPLTIGHAAIGVCGYCVANAKDAVEVKTPQYGRVDTDQEDSDRER